MEAASYTRNLLNLLYTAGWLNIGRLSARSGIPYDALHDTLSGRRCPQLGIVERWAGQLTELALSENQPDAIMTMIRGLDGGTAPGRRGLLLFADSGQVQVWPPQVRSWAAVERLLWEPIDMASALGDQFGLFELSCICQALEMRGRPFGYFDAKRRDAAPGEPQSRLSRAVRIDLNCVDEVYGDSNEPPPLRALHWIREHSFPYPEGENRAASSLREAALKNLRGVMAVEAQGWSVRGS